MGHQGFSEFSLHCPNHAHGQKFDPDSHWLFCLKLPKYLLPRPDSSKLHHPPPSLPNCGTAETDEIFRAVGGVLQGSVSPETR